MKYFSTHFYVSPRSFIHSKSEMRDNNNISRNQSSKKKRTKWMNLSVFFFFAFLIYIAVIVDNHNPKKYHPFADLTRWIRFILNWLKCFVCASSYLFQCDAMVYMIQKYEILFNDGMRHVTNQSRLILCYGSWCKKKV